MTHVDIVVKNLKEGRGFTEMFSQGTALERETYITIHLWRIPVIDVVLLRSVNKGRLISTA